MVRFTQYYFTRMFAGARSLPAHVFPNCPHVKRAMGITNVAEQYRLGPDSRVLQLIRCKWCRSHYLLMMTEDPEMPREVVAGFRLEPRPTEEAPSKEGGSQ